MKLFSPLKSVLVAATMLVTAIAPSFAAQTDDAKAMVQNLATEAISILGNDEQGHEAKIDAFTVLLSRDVDLEFVARFVLGRYWRTVQQDRLDEYVDIYGTYLIRANASRLSAYSGEQIEVVSAIEEKAGRYIVKSVVRQTNGGEDINIDWRVRDRGPDAGLKIVDIMIEGISMALTQRDEFKAVMQKSPKDIAPLINIMQKKIDDSKTGDSTSDAKVADNAG